MNRILCIGAVLLFAVSALAKDPPRHEADQMFFATTGRIVEINTDTRTMLVRGGPRLDKYRVLTTGNTVFQDGADPIQFEDFKAGETISIHGMLSGATLKATRVAKWY